STSCIDVAINPQNADIIYAATWERTRFPWGRVYGGSTSGIHRSKDGGQTWEKLTNGLPLSDSQTGRIGLYVAPSNPDILYASYTTNPINNFFEGLYKSVDGGDSWFLVNSYDLESVNASFGWFFGNIRVSPNNPDDVFVLGQTLYRSGNGGNFFGQIAEEVHVDFHALEVHPLNPNFIVLGCDGGVYISNNGGASWEHIQNLPITQFYTCELDESIPNRYYGGAQDNGTNRTLTGSTDDWQRIWGGDGFYVNVDPQNNDYVYAEFQWGNLYRSEDGGQSFDWALEGIDPEDRTNWNTPVILDPSNPSRLYYGSNRLYVSFNRAMNWSPMSDDLTKGQHPSGSQAFGTITTIAVAPSSSEVIYVGTDDGNVQVTTNFGLDWTNISAGLPNRYVTRVAVDPVDPLTAYVTLSGYRFVDYMPHILRTTDGGQNWEDISGNLPEIPINDVIVDPDVDQTLYIANDLGVWYTFDLGNTWAPLGNELPAVVVNDLRFHQPTRKLLAGTFGRSMFTYDLSEVTSTEEIAQQAPQNLRVFPNPVRANANIQFDWSGTAMARLELFDLQGKKIQTLREQTFAEGVQEINWDASQIPNGTYLLRLSAPGVVATQKLQVMH
ncbi:MAG: T9SS type A sorting domain-containing protein, partial [Bacteroidota bacterium]